MAPRKKQQSAAPPDSPMWKNQTEFRILERTMKRKGKVDQSLFESQENATSHIITIFGSEKEALVFTEFPGMIYVKDAIPIEIQNLAIKKSLQEYTRPPNVSNLDMHFELDPIGVWNQFVGSKDILVKKRHFVDAQEAYPDEEGSKTVDTDTKIMEQSTTLLADLNIKHDQACTTMCQNSLKNGKSVKDETLNITIDKPVDKMLNNAPHLISQVMPRLRWSTLGHQYNWNKKEYHFDRCPEFPPYIASLSTEIIKSIQPLTGYNVKDWKAEAGILNFYQPGDSLTAHQDKSELNERAPLISLSFGLECVFLFGTDDRSTKPIALRLKSGDLIIMSGEARKAFHGVPRVFEDSFPEELLVGEEFDAIREFMEHTRMNINVRQVY
jgi:alkylated DNA repair protein alkB family protein 1